MVDGEDDDDDIDEAAIWEQIRAKEAAEREAAARPSPEQVGGWPEAPAAAARP
jgi:hypothetical protein